MDIDYKQNKKNGAVVSRKA